MRLRDRHRRKSAHARSLLVLVGPFWRNTPLASTVRRAHICPMSKTYEADFYSWAVDQADAARRRSANELDWENVAEELESLGKAQRAELHSRFIILLQHLLKWRFQPDHRSRSWRVSIDNTRRALAKHLRENPGLKQFLEAEFADAYPDARANAALEMAIEEDALPDTSPFSSAEALAADFWPESPADTKPTGK
ncbi:MAG: DUF29 domain-containing protein [Hyphomonadaceae bacterium]|nr:DUF29 domain-containing protein [Hyphomonadaceae bacterium]